MTDALPRTIPVSPAAVAWVIPIVVSITGTLVSATWMAAKYDSRIVRVEDEVVRQRGEDSVRREVSEGNAADVHDVRERIIRIETELHALSLWLQRQSK